MGMKPCCNNCVYSVKDIDIPGLVDCELDGHSKDDDMVCDFYRERKTLWWNDKELADENFAI